MAVAQSQYTVYTSRPIVGIVYILGALGCNPFPLSDGFLRILTFSWVEGFRVSVCRGSRFGCMRRSGFIALNGYSARKDYSGLQTKLAMPNYGQRTTKRANRAANQSLAYTLECYHVWA